MIQKLKYPFVTFLVATLVLFWFYHEVILHANQYLFAAGGDGMKNYYTYLFHTTHDSGFWNFEGMNFPFNEHIVYMDAHPLLSSIVKALGLSQYGIGILNLCMLFSYPVGAVFIYLILNHYKVSFYWAVPVAVAIAFMSPQVFRMTGHLSLSYVFAIPAIWFFTLKFIDGRRLLWSVVIFLFLFGFFFTHPYLGLIMCVFLFVFWLVRMLLIRGSWKESLLAITVHIGSPIILFQLLVKMTDIHLNRTNNPAGFYDLHAHWSSIVLPHHGPLNAVKTMFGLKNSNWESWSYIGFTSIVFFVVVLVLLIIQRKNFEWKKLVRHPLFVALLASYLVLMFAFCIPMKYDFMHWMTDVFGPLKQFRVLGRFAWVFFYVFTIGLVIILYRLKSRSAKPKAFHFLFAVGVVIYVLEFFPVHSYMSEMISANKNSFLEESLDDDLKDITDQINAGSYDAILFMPMDHMSSENIMLLGTENSGRDAMLLSFHTGLPLINSISSRMSFDEANMVNNFFGPEFAEKEFDALIRNKRIAVVRNKDFMKEGELRLEWSSEKVYENERLILLNYQSDKWNNRAYFDGIVKQADAAVFKFENGWRADTAKVWYYYNDFGPSEGPVLLGEGSYADVKSSWNIFEELSDEELDPGDYIMSFWYELYADRPDGLAVIEQSFKDGRDPVWCNQFDIKQSTHIVEGWCLVEMAFSFDSNMSSVKFMVTGNDSQEPMVLDELLVRKAGSPPLFKDVSIGETSYLIYNNYLLRMDSFSEKDPKKIN